VGAGSPWWKPSPTLNYFGTFPTYGLYQWDPWRVIFGGGGAIGKYYYT